ncbi:hypothetical protein [Gelidibacter salicanalis]|uniref:GNAT family N-acetyltransferase n=1 Tax=Gelidibacter salicanalis TaxID=291193 RepID=A0A934NI02_9FLAO|nr:hypothetical protein [Gelidibacter salicanalis]MBJ7880453.1 hypothetical protein [Gelidibacter salicanalis]
MEVGKKDLLYKIRWISNIIKNGLFCHGIRNRLAKIGFDFMPYFWEIGSIDIEPPQIRDDKSKYQLSVFGVEEITFIMNNVIGIDHKDLMNDFKNGNTCLGIKYEEKISVYSFINHQNFSFRGRKFVLKPSESYVHNTYTFENFRGRNLAPYLRYQSYEYFKGKGIDKYYSISEYFNKPTIKYKQKLNVKPLKLYLSVILFKRWVFNFTLKSY